MEVRGLSIAAGDRWQEALSRNDLACWHHEQGQIDEAEEQLALGLEIARGLAPNEFALGVRQSTRSDVRLLAGRAELEGEGMRQLAELRLSVERATVETRAARHENARLAALVDELAAARATLEQRTAELESLKEQFREQADRDWRTGLHNRRYLARQLGSARAFSLAVLDLDHFKGVNDQHGHEAGDQVLVRVANLLLSVVRHSDVVARTGGEEFVLLMPRTELAVAVRCCERALDAIRSALWGDIAPGLRVTGSIGLAGAHEGTGFDPIAALADARLYPAKRAGRDRVVRT